MRRDTESYLWIHILLCTKDVVVKAIYSVTVSVLQEAQRSFYRDQCLFLVNQMAWLNEDICYSIIFITPPRLILK